MRETALAGEAQFYAASKSEPLRQLPLDLQRLQTRSPAQLLSKRSPHFKQSRFFIT